MKKPFVLVAAIAAVVGFGAVAAVAKETINVKTSVTFKYHPNDPSYPLEGGSFSGSVKAKEGCQGGRKVVVYDPSKEIGSDTSNARGRYKIKFIAEAGGPSFHAKAKEKIIKANGDKIVCKPGTSNKFGFGS